MNKLNFDLDVATPEELPRILRLAAQAFMETETTLQSCHQDKSAGRVWREFGKILDRAANQADKAIEKFV